MKRYKILLVDDNSDLLSMLAILSEMVFKGYNAEVLTAQTEADALRLLDQFRDSLLMVITDGDLGNGGRGEPVATAACETYGVPNVFFSSGGEPRSELAEGVIIVQKPVNWKKYLSRIRDQVAGLLASDEDNGNAA